MDAKLKADWIAALRSGKYRQGIGFLNSDKGFCCLGVLCDISGDGEWKPDNDPEIDCQLYWIGTTATRAVLDEKSIRKHGFSGGTISDLIDMNDRGKSFAEIANYIEQNL